MPSFDWTRLGPFVKAVKTAVGAGALAMGKAVQNDIRENFSSGRRLQSSSAGSAPMIQRNQLRNSIDVALVGDMVARVGSKFGDVRSAVKGGAAVKYGWVQETGNGGAPIRAKNVKYLPVPVNDAARRLHESKGMQSLRAYPMRFIKPMFGRQALLVGDNGVRTQFYTKDASGKSKTVVRRDQPVFVLKKSITIPKRPFIAPALARARGNPALVKAFAIGVNASLRASNITAKVVPA